MKKELSVFALAMAPAFALAQATGIGGTTTVQTNDCSLLQDNLRIQLSSNVVGAYNCDTTNNVIAISACHTSGRVAARNQVVITNASACTTAGATTPCVTATSNVSGAVIPAASTAGGSMDMKFPGATCSSSTAASQI